MVAVTTAFDISLGGGHSRAVDALADQLIELGHCDQRGIERARRVAAETDQRLDNVLLQLGLATERGLAEGYAALLGARIATPERYPAAEPLFPERLTA